MKKLISILMSILMVAMLMIPAMSVAAADEGYLTIYIEGYGHPLYKDNENPSAENQIFPTGDIFSPILDGFGKDSVNLAKAMVTGDYTEYGNGLYDTFTPMFSAIQLDKNGEASDGSGFGGDMLTKEYTIDRSVYPDGKILFEYDWRLSVEHTAEILEKFIDRVCEEQDVEKVNLLGRCLGGNIISAYLQNGKNHNKVNDVVMLIASTEGVDFISALFSGQIVLDTDAVENWANYFLSEEGLITDPEMNAFVTSLVSLINELKVLGLGIDFVQTILDKVKDNVLVRVVRESFGSCPSFWSMVSDEYFEDAINFIFPTDEIKAEYKGLIDKAYSFHDNVQLNARDTMKDFQAKGHDIMVISKYNYANYPLSKDAFAQTDGTALTSATSFGAVCADYESTLSAEYIAAMSAEDKKYLSPDNIIDASTCLLPDTTWFIKNCYHNNFPEAMDQLIVKFMNSDNMTVFSDPTYPQFVDYDLETGTISPVIAPDAEKESFNEALSVYINFIRNLVSLIVKLFGEGIAQAA